MKLWINCPHREAGCEWRGELGEVEHHLSKAIHPGKSFQCENDVGQDRKHCPQSYWGENSQDPH